MGNMDLTNSQTENAKLAAGMEQSRETEATKDAALAAAARADACASGSAAGEARALGAAAPASERSVSIPCETDTQTKYMAPRPSGRGAGLTGYEAGWEAPRRNRFGAVPQKHRRKPGRGRCREPLRRWCKAA